MPSWSEIRCEQSGKQNRGSKLTAVEIETPLARTAKGMIYGDKSAVKYPRHGELSSPREGTATVGDPNYIWSILSI